jgi:5-methylcytosine-specific restriction protein B
MLKCTLSRDQMAVSLFVSLMRVRNAIFALQLWRDKVDSQNAKHLIHFLSAKKGGVNAKGFIDFSEADDKAFCDDALKVRSGEFPYYDPLDSEFRIDTHPHSNVATARKKTFAGNTWKAAEFRTKNDREQWKFSANYLDILKEKLITRGGQTTRIPIYDLCAWLYRTAEFNNDSSLATVVDRFKSDYRISDAELKSLFDTYPLEGEPESEKTFFTHHKTSDPMLLEMVKDPQNYDLSDSIAEAFSNENKSPVSVDDIVQLLLHGRKQLALQGPPGTGKTYLAKQSAGSVLGLNPSQADFILQLNKLFIDLNASVEEMAKQFAGKGGWTIVQFHPSYTYEDFVRGLAPEGHAGGMVSFAVQDRTFAKICHLARRLSPQPIVLVIDEINRGDLSKVLGELIYALEYRDEPVALQYAKAGESAFCVPSNLFIITTLNTADRSIANIDYAIRRRFDFIELAPDRTVIERFQENSPVKDGALAIFDAVSKLLENARDNAVGHSYFLDRGPDPLARSIVFQVLPLLAEYRVEGILGDADSIQIPGWPGKSGIPFHHERPFELAKLVASWLETYSQRSSSAAT